MSLCALYLITSHEDKTDDVLLVDMGNLAYKKTGERQIERRSGGVE
jgi:hypothetical protein